MKFEPHKKVKNFYTESKHTLSMSYKPTPEGFRRTLKIVIAGILILGIMGYVISTILGFIV
jgi:protein translocase SEC61 complex gamma subunit